MTLVVVGPGAVGSAVAACLEKSGIAVHLLGKERHKKHFAKNPVIYKTMYETLKERVHPITFEDLAERQGEHPVTAVLVTLKANITTPMLEKLATVLPKDVPIVSLQNGLIAREIFDKTPFENIYACVIGFNIKTESLGKVAQTSEGEIQIGKVEGASTKGKGSNNVPEFLTELLSKVAPTKVSENIQGDVWMKVIINSTINPICTIGNMPLGDLPKNQSSISLSLWTWRELVNVVDALDIKLNPFQGQLYPEVLYGYDLISYSIAKKVMKRVVEPHKDAIVSMLQDIRNGRSTEIDFLNGKVYELGQPHNVEMPVNEMIIGTIRQLEKGELQPSKALLRKLYYQKILQ